MSMPNIAPYGQYGAWPSPISAATVAAGATPLSQLALGADGDIYWLAGRPAEGGRSTLLRRRGAHTAELTPLPQNVRSRVHEYGGGSYAAAGDPAAGDPAAGDPAAGDTVYFCNDADKRLYRKVGDAPAEPFTQANRQRFADFAIDTGRGRLIAVREQHPQDPASYAHPDNTLCAVGFDGAETVLVQGNDFYSSPRLSPDGRQLAWLSWDHPRMPWQGTELWLATVRDDGTLDQAVKVAGGPDEAICQPEWAPDGVLYFVSDRSGWWNLYRHTDNGPHPVCPMEAEFGSPHWVFGNAMYGFTSSTEIAATYIEQGISKLARIDLQTGKLTAIATPYGEIRELKAGPGFVAVLAGSPVLPLELARIDLATGARDVLATSIDTVPDTGYLSVPQSISYPSANGRTAHAFYYPPANKDVQAPAGSKPPVIVIGHGGPTGMTVNTLKLATQYWTSRGFGVLDVNYGGSTGFGRAYRDLLKGQWGIVDVEDCVAGARHLAHLHTIHRPVFVGLVMALSSGVLLLAADVETFARSPVFWVKMVLLGLLLANGYLLAQTETTLREGEPDSPVLWARLRYISVASIVLWLGLILAGTVLMSS